MTESNQSRSGNTGSKGLARRAIVSLSISVAVFGVAAMLLLGLGSSDLEGSLYTSGRLGDSTFIPDHCESGQTYGFFGVELSSEAQPRRRIRLLRDTLKGAMVTVEATGGSQPLAVFGAADCSLIDVNIVKTNNRVNSVYVVEGRASIECPELVGTVQFGGCH